MTAPDALGMPATIRRHAAKIREAWHDSDGWWVVLRRGLCVAGPGAHTIHEPTLAKCAERLADPDACDCDACVGAN